MTEPSEKARRLVERYAESLAMQGPPPGLESYEEMTANDEREEREAELLEYLAELESGGRGAVLPKIVQFVERGGRVVFKPRPGERGVRMTASHEKSGRETSRLVSGDEMVRLRQPDAPLLSFLRECSSIWNSQGGR